MLKKYSLEFVLLVGNTGTKTVKNALSDFGDDLEIIQDHDKRMKITLTTIDPTVIFDICAQFGRITSAKIE